MWVFTSFGILMPGLRPKGTVPEGDDRVLQVRARRRQDLEILREQYMGDTLGEIICLPHTDYEFRAYCTLEAWANALGQIALDIDYVKFKETSETKYGDKKLHQLYVKLWGAIFSGLSTREHQREYWNGGRRSHRPAATVAPVETSRLPWWEDAELPRVTFRDHVTTPAPTDFYEKVERGEAVIRFENGTIDHSHCPHGNSKNARRRCQRQHNGK